MDEIGRFEPLREILADNCVGVDFSGGRLRRHDGVLGPGEGEGPSCSPATPAAMSAGPRARRSVVAELPGPRVGQSATMVQCALWHYLKP